MEDKTPSGHCASGKTALRMIPKSGDLPSKIPTPGQGDRAFFPVAHKGFFLCSEYLGKEEEK